MSRELWIGLAQVSEARPGALGGRQGAYVNLLASVDGECEFRARVGKALADEGLLLQELEEVGPLDVRWPPESRTTTYDQLAKQAEASDSVVFGTIHRYLDEE